MAVSSRGVVALVLAGAASAHAATLSAFPKYCSKEMDSASIPPLNDSVVSSFGGDVSLADVELLQVGVVPSFSFTAVSRCAFAKLSGFWPPAVLPLLCKKEEQTPEK